MFEKILIMGPPGSRAYFQSNKIASNFNYNFVSFEDALKFEVDTKTFVGDKILRSVRYKKYDSSILGDILSKTLQCDRWVMEGFQPSSDLIETFDELEIYPDIVIVLLNTQISLLDRIVKNGGSERIISINKKIVEHLENIDRFVLDFEKMNIPVYTINDNKTKKDIYDIIIELINNKPLTDR
jgi:hypothetical protein